MNKCLNTRVTIDLFTQSGIYYSTVLEPPGNRTSQCTVRTVSGSSMDKTLLCQEEGHLRKRLLSLHEAELIFRDPHYVFSSSS